MRIIDMAKKSIVISLIILVSFSSACACAKHDNIKETTASISVSEETASQNGPKTESQNTPVISENTNERYIVFNGEKISYEDILSEAGVIEIFATEESMDLSRFEEVFDSFGYIDTQSDAEDLPEVVTCMESEDGLDKITLSEYASAEDAHNAVYKYVVTEINAYKQPEMTYGLLLETSLQDSYLWVSHMSFQESRVQMILFYQTGASVISAQIELNGLRIDTFAKAMQEVGFVRSGVTYGLEENPFPDKAGACTVTEFSGILTEYGYPIEQQLIGISSVYGANEDNTVYWTFEQYDSVADSEMLIAMNYANAWMMAKDQELSYYSGENYEMWIEDSKELGHKINIRVGDTFLSICGSPNDDAMKEHIRSMITDAFF